MLRLASRLPIAATTRVAHKASCRRSESDRLALAAAALLQLNRNIGRWRHASSQPLTSVGAADLLGKPPVSPEEGLAPEVGVLGMWHYDSSMSYVISVDAEGRYRFDEWDVGRRIHHHGVLSDQDDWLQADLRNQDGRAVGTIRLRFDAERNVVVSQVRAFNADWGPVVTAYSAGSTELAGMQELSSRFRENPTPFFVLLIVLGVVPYLVWESVTWSGTLRPFFASMGLEGYADDLERAYKGMWRSSE
mmetsp:Transcript_75587/g.210007  ORF Transcript_75587/g.210007 Transcript_75587/m.210007 type:complete len:248 (-) Transcript_75587:56-799(-)